jgi:hypothetical protein
MDNHVSVQLPPEEIECESWLLEPVALSVGIS